MNKRVSITDRWYGPVPTKNGKPLPKNQWARAGQRRKWTVRWYSPDGKRPRQTFNSKEDAEAFARSKTAEFESRGPTARIRPERVTLGAYAKEFEELRIGPGGERLAIASLREYMAVLNRFCCFIGSETLLADLAPVDAARYVAYLRSTPSRRGKALSVASLNKHKRGLKAVFNVAARQLGYLNHNPYSGLRQDRVAEQSIRCLSPAEFRKLIEACGGLANRSEWWAAFLTVAYTAGARANEIVHLTWSDIDFESDTIRIVAKPDTGGLCSWRPKGYKARTVPVPQGAIALLTSLHASAQTGTDFIFIDPVRISWIEAQRAAGTWKEGRAVLNNLTRDFKALVRRAKIDDATLHDPRRSCISHWARKIPAAVVRELAGHASIQTTLKFYVSIGDADLALARDATAQTLSTIDPE